MTCVSCGPLRVSKCQNIACNSSLQTLSVDSTLLTTIMDKSNDDRIPDFVRAPDLSFQWSELVSREAFLIGSSLEKEHFYASIRKDW